MLAALLDIVATWGSLYANHPALRTAVSFGHFAGLLAGGGAAVVADLGTLRASRMDAAARLAQLTLLARTHRAVMVSMMLITISGLLLVAADLDTYVSSTVFWLKLALIGLLWVNGGLLFRAESRAERGDASAWGLLRGTAAASLGLWFLVTLAGAALPNIG